MAGIRLYQPSGVGPLNDDGVQHPAPVEIDVNQICQLSFVGGSTSHYRWVLSKPSSSASVLSSTTSAGPSFMPDVEGGSYSVSLFDADETEYVLDIVTPTTGVGGGTGGGTTVTTTYETYDDVRAFAFAPGAPPGSFIVQGRTSVADGGEGPFIFDADDSSTDDNDGTVIVDADGNRFRRVYTGPLDVRWFGASPNTVDNSDALQAALDAGNHVFIPAGEFDYTTRLVVRTGTSISGAGVTSILNYTGSGTAIRHENPTGTNTAQMVWENFAIRGGSSSLIGIELVNAYDVTLNNIDVSGQNSGFDSCGIRLTNAFGAYNCATITIASGTRVHECFGDGIQVYYPADVTATFNATTNFVTANSHGKQDGDLVMFQTSGSMSGTGLTAGVFYYVVNRTTNTFQVAATSGGSPIDLLAAGTGTHSIIGSGAPIGGLTIIGCTIDQCENGLVADAGTVGVAGEVTVTGTLFQACRATMVTGSFLHGAFSGCHFEQGGAAMTSGASFLVGTDQNVYALSIGPGNLFSGVPGGQDYNVNITPGGAARYNVTVRDNFFNRADIAGVKVQGVQGVDIGQNYYGNTPATAILTANTGVRYIGADAEISTTDVRTVVSDNYSATVLDEFIGVTGSSKTITLPGASEWSAYGGKRFIIFNFVDTTTTIATTAPDEVNGASSYALTGQYSSVTLLASSDDGGSSFHWAVLGTHSVWSTGSVVRVLRGMPFLAEADADVDEYGEVTINTNAGTAVKWPIEVPHGCSLASVELRVQGGGNADLPAVMPLFRVRTLLVTDGTQSSQGPYTDASINVSQYNAIHSITASLTPITVDNAARRYTIEFISESGANAVTGYKVLGIYLTFTTTAPDKGAA